MPHCKNVTLAQELKGKVTEADETIASQVSEVQKLTHIINEADAERSRMKKVALAACWTVGFCNVLL